jgi:hypothetical protein
MNKSYEITSSVLLAVLRGNIKPKKHYYWTAYLLIILVGIMLFSCVGNSEFCAETYDQYECKANRS